MDKREIHKIQDLITTLNNATDILERMNPDTYEAIRSVTRYTFYSTIHDYAQSINNLVNGVEGLNTVTQQNE